jgi:DUF971 family protein
LTNLIADEQMVKLIHNIRLSKVVKDELTDLERSTESCILRFADGNSFRVDYIEIRLNCPCANCNPRQSNEQRLIEFREEIMRLQLVKPKVELVGRYGMRFSWPTGCSSGIYSFGHLRETVENFGSAI